MKNIYQKINAVLEEGKSLEKTGEMRGQGFKFHQTDEVLAFLRPLLSRHGINMSYTVLEHSCDYREYAGKDGPKLEKQTVKTVQIRLTNVDEPLDFIEGIEFGYGVDPMDKGPGKATSYAIKTWLLNTFLLRGQPNEEFVPLSESPAGPDIIANILSLVEETESDFEGMLAYGGVKTIGDLTGSSAIKIQGMLIDKKKKKGMVE